MSGAPNPEPRRRGYWLIASLCVNFFLIGAKCGFIFPSDLLLHAKAITTAEALFFTVVPDMNFVEVTKPIIAREFFQRAFDWQRLQRKCPKSCRSCFS